MKKVLLFPGAFNPPHNGHISAVEAVLKKMLFDELWIIPSGKRDDKTISISYEDRHNLGNIFVEQLQAKTTIPVSLATDELSDIKGKGTKEILKEIKSRPGIQFIQLIGLDGYLEMRKKLIGDMNTFNSEKFIVVKRPWHEIPNDFTHYDNAVILNEATQDISSTQIRTLAKNHDFSYKKLVPEKIAAYIHDHNLYL